jgi:hypothetical protein
MGSPTLRESETDSLSLLLDIISIRVWIFIHTQTYTHTFSVSVARCPFVYVCDHKVAVPSLSMWVWWIQKIVLDDDNSRIWEGMDGSCRQQDVDGWSWLSPSQNWPLEATRVNWINVNKALLFYVSKIQDTLCMSIMPVYSMSVKSMTRSARYIRDTCLRTAHGYLWFHIFSLWCFYGTAWHDAEPEHTVYHVGISAVTAGAYEEERK